MEDSKKIYGQPFKIQDVPSCSFGLVEKKSGGMMPLSKSHIHALVKAGVAIYNVSLEYYNGSENPLECDYQFSLEKDTTFSQLTAVIDDKEVVTKVEEKAKAEERYGDAVAGGKLAVLGTSKKNEEREIISVKIGNILPDSTCVIKMQLINKITIENQAYRVSTPAAFFPDYTKLGFKKDQIKYDFRFTASIQGNTKLCYVSAPMGSEHTVNEDGKQVSISCEKPGKSMDLYYRTQDMLRPCCVYAEHPDFPGEVACQYQFMPTFADPQTQQELEFVEGEKPEEVALPEHLRKTGMTYTFLIDRSGSMGWKNRIDKAKEALTLFIRSLPTGSRFEICSFGSVYSFEIINEKDRNLILDSQTAEEAIKVIDGMFSDYGGTDILTPLTDALESDSFKNTDDQTPGAGEKRIFLLTDGQVGNNYAIIMAAENANTNNRVFTFAIGDDADRNLCKETAKAGRGTCSSVYDNQSTKDLKAAVVNALKSSSQPSLQDCELIFNGKSKKLGEMFADTYMTDGQIMNASEFEQMQLVFSSKLNPETNQPIKLILTKSDFTKIEDPQLAKCLFKTIAHKKMGDASNRHNMKTLSLKYQVLCEETSLIGVVKQKKKADGELVEDKQVFGHYKDTGAPIEQQKAPKPVPQVSQSYDHLNFSRGLGSAQQSQPKKQMSRGRAMPAPQMAAAPMSRQMPPPQMAMGMAAAPMSRQMPPPQMAMAAPQRDMGMAMAPPSQGMMMKSKAAPQKAMAKAQESSGSGVFGSLKNLFSNIGSGFGGGNSAAPPKEDLKAKKKSMRKASPPRDLAMAQECATFDSDVVIAMKSANIAKSAMEKQCDIDKMEDLQDMMCEDSPQEDIDMGAAFGADEDDLANELDELEAEEMMAEACDLGAMQPPMAAMAMKAPAAQACASSYEEQKQEEDLLALMMDGPSYSSQPIEQYQQNNYAAESGMGQAIYEPQPAGQILACAEAEKKDINPLSLNDILTKQDVSSGFWASSHLSALAQALQNGLPTESQINDYFNGLPKLEDDSQKMTIFATLLALYILAELFDNDEDEWSMIARKGKNFLKSNGITKPNTFIDAMSFELKMSCAF